MSEEEKSELEKKKFHKVLCYRCGLPLNIQTTEEVGYKVSQANIKVWCVHCQRYCKIQIPENARFINCEEKK